MLAIQCDPNNSYKVAMNGYGAKKINDILSIHAELIQ